MPLARFAFTAYSTAYPPTPVNSLGRPLRTAHAIMMRFHFVTAATSPRSLRGTVSGTIRRVLLAGIALAAQSSWAENWPQWRGPNNNGVSGEKSAPIEWNREKNIAWRLEMPGSSAATPAVWGDRIFLTSG